MTLATGECATAPWGIGTKGWDVMSGTQAEARRRALLAAAGDAVHAPSIFNTQPWRWSLDAAGLTLHADRARRLAVVDPHGTLLLLSCGAALHHARVALAAAEWAVEVDRPVRSPYGDEPLARLTITGPAQPDPAVLAMHAAIPRRRTDRRPFAEQPVPTEVLAQLEAAAAAEGTRLHRVRLDQMPMLSVAVAAAGATELADPRYRIELIQWTNRPEWSNDGVPPGTAVQHAPRRVPVRDFSLFPEQGMEVKPGGDQGAAYLVLFGTGDEPLDWLRAGEALSAVLLTAVGAGLAVAPFTDVIEVEHSRGLVRGLLPGRSHPYVLIRCGYPTGLDAPPAAPRRGVDEVLQT